MDLLQAISDNLRAPKPKNAIRLGTLAKMLREAYIEVTKDKENFEYVRIAFDFAMTPPAYVVSYRGYYEDLAIIPALGGEQRAERFIEEIESAIGTTFQGYKGGDFTMNHDTMIWVVQDASRTSATYITDVKIVRGYLIVMVTETDFDEL